MPLGQYTITLQITGVFRDARNAAFEIRRLAMAAAEAEARTNNRASRDALGASMGWSPTGQNPIRIQVT